MTTKIQKQSNNYTFHRTEAYDIIDSIINKAQKECDIMKESTVAKWEIPKYSKSEINKAGKTIADKNMLYIHFYCHFSLINRKLCLC